MNYKWNYLPIQIGFLSIALVMVFDGISTSYLGLITDYLFICIPFFVLATFTYVRFLTIPTVISSWLILAFYLVMIFNVYYQNGEGVGMFIPLLYSIFYLVGFFIFGVFFKWLMSFTPSDD